MKKLFFIFIAQFWSAVSFSQNVAVDIFSVIDSVSIINNTGLFIDSNNVKDIDIIKNYSFQPLAKHRFQKKIPTHLVLKDFYYQFSLKNSSTFADTVYLYPGYLVSSMKLYVQDSAGGIIQVPTIVNSDGFLMLRLAGGISSKFLLKISLARARFFSLSPDIINKNYLSKYQIVLYNQDEQLKAFGYIVSGILLLMLLFTAYNYIISGKKEFLYYCGYTFCMLCLVFFKAVFRKKITQFSIFFDSYFDFILLAAGTICYVAFTRFFLNTKKNYKPLDKLFKIEEWVLVCLIVSYTMLRYFGNLFWLETFIENSMRFIVLALGIVYIALALKKKEKYTIYLAYGNAAMIFFSIISWLLILYKRNGDNHLFRSSLFYYNIGLAISLILFLLGLTYKNTNELIQRAKKEEAIKQEIEKQEIENQLSIVKAQQEERNRISADMHDDLGAGVTSIRLYSELAKNKAKDNDVPEIDKISSLANELLNKMNAIIWSMSSSYDSLENLGAYIRNYALEYFENTGIDCRVIFPDNLPASQVAGEVRRNIFLVIKEALHNILKHSKAQKVEIVFKHSAGTFELNIHDNGTGIDFSNIKQFGNGLQNMKKRMASIGINFIIENKNGTLVTLSGKIST